MPLTIATTLHPLWPMLAERLAVPLSSPLQPEHVVVPGAPTGDWLAAVLAEQNGVVFNMRAYTPGGLLAELGGPSLAAPGTWHVYDALLACREHEPFESVARYLQDDTGGLKGVQLAERVGGLFGRYCRYRPEMLQSWSAGAAEGWQPELWRRLVARLGDPVAAAYAFMAAPDAGKIPERLSVFGVWHLAPLELEVLRWIERRLDLAVFAVTEAPVVRQLAEWMDVSRIDSPPTGGALGVMQRGGAPVASVRLNVGIHACHGRLREVEVLRDELLRLFDADRTLQPEDVVVLAPDINDYAAQVEGVFGTEADVSKAVGAAARFPACFADRAPLVNAPGLAALGEVLSLAGSRRPFAAVAALLDSEPVRRRFELSESEAATAREWLVATGVRWGEDAAFRARFDNPELPQHTWRWGLDRLLLGYAIDARGERLWGGVLPVEGVEGKNAAPLGGLCAFCEALFAQLAELERNRPASAWGATLLGAFDALVSTAGPGGRDRAILVRALEGLDGNHDVGLLAVRAWLDPRLEVVDRRQRFFAGGINFASLRLGRAVPARVVALLGLDHDRFPRDPPALDFDLLATGPLPADLPPRLEDRHSFRAAALAAADHLHLSYVGHGIRDNQERPPSVLLAETLDALRAASAGVATVHHPMQGFSPRAFSTERAGFSITQHAAASALLSPAVEAPAFVDRPLPPDRVDSTLDLAVLVKFFKNPVEFFLVRRLGLRMGREEAEVPDHEPISLDSLEKWKVGDALLDAMMAGGQPEALWPAMRERGWLPMGTPGRMQFDAIAELASAIAQLARAQGAGTAVSPVDIDLSLARRRLRGRLGHRHERGALVATYSKLGFKQRLGAWIPHLATQVAGVRPADTWLCGRGDRSGVQALPLVAVPGAEAALAALIDLFEWGQSRPLPFMPGASGAYAAAFVKASSSGGADPRAAACAAALEAWLPRTITGGEQIPGDGDDASVARVYDASVIRTEPFHCAALIAFGPMLGRPHAGEMPS